MKHILTLLLVCMCTRLTANNLQITNVSLTGADFVNDFTKIRFDVSWDNSWRDAINWDAVWIFAKYSTDAGLTWKHAWLNTTPGNHTVPAAATLTVGVTNISATDRGMGVFLHRAASGSGSISWTNIQMRWDYGLQGVDDYAPVMIRVFGIEMVYIRDGNFWLGDGTITNITGHFEAGTSGVPFQVTGEGLLTLGGGGAGSLGNNNAAGMTIVDDFNDITTKTLPAAFPKGYAAFYCMKHEVTQEQYRDFLNTLTRTQQESRVATDITSVPIANRFVMSNTATINYRAGIRCDASPSLTQPVTFYCDFDAIANYDDPTDGHTIACNYLSSSDLKAYLDWSGLRPLTEMEYEKACRGPLAPVPDEYAWGNTDATATTSLINTGTVSEKAGNAGANCVKGSASGGPIRSGAFAGGSTSRRDAGASYWGIMELTGNLYEGCVSVGISTSRSYTGLHGNGELTSAGASDVSAWPTSLSLRGGGHCASDYAIRVSGRHAGSYPASLRDNCQAGRGVRTAP